MRKKTTMMNQTFDVPLTETVSLDGKRDNILKNEKTGCKSYRRKVIEHHISILIEPVSHYSEHFTPETESEENFSTRKSLFCI